MSRLTYALKIVERYAREYKNSRLEDLGLVSRQAEILLRVCRAPGYPQDKIAEDLLIAKSGVTRHLTVLEEKGLITRCQSKTDRRQMLVYPTQAALPLEPAIRQVNEQWSEFVTQGLSPEQQELLVETLSAVVSRIREAREEDVP